MKRLVILLVIGLINFHCIAQNNKEYLKVNENFSEKSQYLFNRFVKGKIYFRDGKTKSIDMNYNVIVNELHYTEDNRLRAISDSDYEKITKLTIGDLSFINIDKKIYEILYEGKVSVLKRRLTVQESESKGAYGTSSKSASQEKFSRMSLAIGHEMEKGVLVNFPGESSKIKIKSSYKFFDNSSIFPANKRSLLKIYDNKSDDLKAYLKKQKNNFKKEDNLVELIKYCSSLK